jgi:cobalt-zinc-cadmium resistance protein CzcA
VGPVERFVAGALRQRPFVLLCLVVFAATGFMAWREVPVEAFPDLTNNQVVVVTEAHGLAAIEVEQRVTYPIETALMGAPGATEVRSLSKFGLSMITVVFEDRVPIYFARQLVAERLSEARGRIPEGLAPTLGPVATAFGEIYQYLVEGEADPMERKTVHDWEVRTRLRSVKGVSEVNSWGGLTKQYHVIVYPLRLDRYGLSLQGVVRSVADNNATFSGGFVEHRSERFTVRGSGLASGVDDLRRIVLASVEGVPILLGDVAEVGVGPLPRSGAVTRDGEGETVAGMVIMLKGENGREVASRVKARIAEIEKTFPAGMRIVPFYDQSEVIDRTSRTVRRNLLEGSLLVVLVLFFFLRDVRASLIVASVIPLAMLAGFLGMRLFGVSANLMSLGAIDFGLIVDGAVVMMENFIRRRAAHTRAGEPESEIDPAGQRRKFFTSAAVEVARPVLFGVLIIVAVYVPVFTLEGLEGKMFRPMAITVCSAILGALVLALTVVPVASSYLLKLEGVEREPTWFLRVRRRYLAHLEDAMNHPRRTISTAAAVVGAAMGSLALIGTEFMPRLDEGAILVETRKLPSISLEESASISTRIEQIVGRFPEVKQVVTKIGRPDVATEAMGIYQGDVYVNLHPMDEWESGWSKEELIGRMAASLAEMPGVTCNFTQPMAMRLDEVVSGVKADVAVKVFGPDPLTLERVGESVRSVLGRVRGAADLQVEVLSGASQVQIDIDRARIARYGLNVSDVRELVQTAVGGSVATEILDGPRRFDVVVRFPDEVRGDPERLGHLLLTAPGGEKLPLASVAQIRIVEGPEAVNHESGQRRLVVQTNVRGRDVGGFVAEAQRRVASSIELPSGYFIEWGGQFENQQRATRRLMVVIPASLAIIFLLLFVTFGHFRQAALVILNVPFALVGGVAALWLRGLNLNLSASVGFIALFGVAVLNGIVMIAAINRLRREDHLELRPSILRGAATRLKPVMMTALVAAFGFVPMALSEGAGAEVQRPLASVVIGGITTSTLLTLIVLPTLYEIIEARALRRRDDG